MRWLRVIGGLAACVLPALSVACGEGEPTSGEAEPGAPGRVLLVGDSLFFQAADELERALRGDGWEVTIAAQPGAGLGGGGYADIDWARRLDQRLQGIEPDAAVVELGTNGCGTACRSIPGAIATIMDRLADVPVVMWLTVRPQAPRPDEAEAINGALHRAADRRDNLELLPYHEWLDDRPELLQADDVHLTVEGQELVATRVRDALRARSLAGA